MESVTSSSTCFRHVVFPDTQSRVRRVVNLAPPGSGRLVAVRDLPRGRVAGRIFPGAAELALEFQERALLESILSRAGVDASSYRAESLARRLPACLRALRAPSPRRARRALEDDPSLRPAALSALLIGVTSFFRDPQVFSVLASRVVPDLERLGRPVRAWSAGCSDGAELYSLAVVLAEFGLLGRLTLLGTDCRGDAIEHARAGLFPADALRTVHPDWVGRYFTPAAGAFRVRGDLRAAAEWRCEDLLRPSRGPEPQPGGREEGFDVILCRNVAIYLTVAAADALWRRLYAGLRPGGVLVTGKAERPALPGLRRLSACVFRKEARAA